MDQKSSERKKLDPLPNAGDSFWPEDADNKEITAGRSLTCEKGQHVFTYGKRANEAKCNRCPIGYILSVGAEIKNGRIIFGNITV